MVAFLSKQQSFKQPEKRKSPEDVTVPSLGAKAIVVSSNPTSQALVVPSKKTREEFKSISFTDQPPPIMRPLGLLDQPAQQTRQGPLLISH